MAWRKPQKVYEVITASMVMCIQEKAVFNQSFADYLAKQSDWVRKDIGSVFHFMQTEGAKLTRDQMSTVPAEHALGRFNKAVKEHVLLYIDQIYKPNPQNGLEYIKLMAAKSFEAGFRSPELGACLICFYHGVLLLLGSERHLLVGFERGQPLFHRIDPPINRSSDVAKALNRAARFSTIPSLKAREQLLLLPNFWEVAPLSSDNRVGLERRDYLADALQLLEDAYYNQRYLLNPNGAEVRLEGFGDHMSAKLTVWKDQEDYLTIFAVFQTKDGFYLQGLPEAALLASNLFQEIEFSSQGESALGPGLFLLVKMYHDLVTAEMVEESGEQVAKKLAEPEAESNSSGQQRIILLRRRYNLNGKPVNEPSRHPIKQMHEREPHGVSGHKRRLQPGHRMSQKQLEEVQAFEAKTKLQIMRFIPEGYTFVMPHISPTIEDWSEVPRVIKARLQRDLYRLIALEPEGAAE